MAQVLGPLGLNDPHREIITLVRTRFFLVLALLLVSCLLRSAPFAALTWGAACAALASAVGYLLAFKPRSTPSSTKAWFARFMLAQCVRWGIVVWGASLVMQQSSHYVMPFVLGFIGLQWTGMSGCSGKKKVKALKANTV